MILTKHASIAVLRLKVTNYTVNNAHVLTYQRNYKTSSRRNTLLLNINVCYLFSSQY